MVWVEVVVVYSVVVVVLVAGEVDKMFAWCTPAGRVATCWVDVAVAAVVAVVVLHRRHRDSCHREHTEEEDHGTFVAVGVVEAVVAMHWAVAPRGVAADLLANHCCCMDSECHCYCCYCLVET